MNAHGAMGHNSAGLSPDDRKVLLFHHLRVIDAVDVKIKTLQEERKELRRRAKGDGFEMGDEIDFSLKIMRAEDEETIAASVARRLQIAAFFNLPINFQMGLFDGVDRAPAVDAAFDGGVRAGLLGKDPSPPHGADTEQGQAWMRGWHQAQERMRDVLQRNMEARNADAAGTEQPKSAPNGDGELPAMKRRGRPKGSKNKPKQSFAETMREQNDRVAAEMRESASADPFN